MVTYWDYAYCEKCDRPFRKNECRSESTGSHDNQRTIYYCRVCESLARDFNKIIIRNYHTHKSLYKNYNTDKLLLQKVI